MTLSVAGRRIQDLRQLSALGRHALAFIDGGIQWVQWSTQSVTTRYQFADETSLLDGIQRGLYGTPYAWLPTLGIRISPVKLLTLGQDNLAILADAESGAPTQVLQIQVQRVLSSHAIVTSHDLSAVSALLDDLGVGKAPLFAFLEQSEALALLDLAMHPGVGSAELRCEAAAFALKQAHSPLEFCDYYLFYLELPPTAGNTPQARGDTAMSTMTRLLPQLFETLDCPQLKGLPSPIEVRDTISQFLATGRQLGFARISLAMQQIARFSGLLDEGVNASETVRRYMSATSALLQEHPPGRGLLGQDGSTVRFPIVTRDRQLTIGVDDGLVSIVDVRQLPPAPSLPTEQA